VNAIFQNCQEISLLSDFECGDKISRAKLTFLWLEKKIGNFGYNGRYQLEGVKGKKGFFM